MWQNSSIKVRARSRVLITNCFKIEIHYSRAKLLRFFRFSSNNTTHAEFGRNDPREDAPHFKYRCLEIILPFVTLLCLAKWVAWCLLCCVGSAKYLKHISQVYFFSSVWIFLCRSKLCFVVKPFKQISHLKGVSPVCVRKCSSRRSARPNDWNHN